MRTIFTIGLLAIAGLFVLRLAFGLFGVLFAMLLTLVLLAVKIAAVGVVIYLLIRIFSPATARKLRERWSGSSAV